MPIPRRAKYARIRLFEYALSAATRCGKRPGLPLPGFLMAPPSISFSNTVDSCASPGVSSNTTGLPLPSQRTCILVENPPWLRLKASESGSPFRPQRRAHQHAAGAIYEVDLPLNKAFGISTHLYLSKGAVPDTCLTPARVPPGRSARTPSCMNRSVQASLPKELLFA